MSESTYMRHAREQIRARLRTAADAFNRGDLDEFMQLFLPGETTVLITEDGNYIKGTPAIREVYEKRIGKTKSTIYGIEKFEVIEDRHAHIIFAGGVAPDGKINEGIISLLMRRIDGVWYIVCSHSMSTIEPVAAARAS